MLNIYLIVDIIKLFLLLTLITVDINKEKQFNINLYNLFLKLRATYLTFNIYFNCTLNFVASSLLL